MIKLPDITKKRNAHDLIGGDIAIILNLGELYLAHMTDFSGGKRLYSLNHQKVWHPAGFSDIEIIRILESGETLEIE